MDRQAAIIQPQIHGTPGQVSQMNADQNHLAANEREFKIRTEGLPQRDHARESALWLLTALSLLLFVFYPQWIKIF